MSSSAQRPHTLLRVCQPPLAERCARACELVKQGKYEEARDVLGDVWQGVGVPPQLPGVEAGLAAELMLCTAVISGHLGSAEQLKGAQEATKNLLTECSDVFSSLGERVRWAAAQLELGYCYWREGLFDQARAVFEVALTDIGEADNDLRALGLIRWAFLEKTDRKFMAALQLLVLAEPLAEASTSDFLKGTFFNTRAGVLNHTGGSQEERATNAARALCDYRKAREHFQRVGHARYVARVENNTGFRHYLDGRYPEAHEHLACARAIFEELDDFGSVAQVDETRAKVFIAQRLYSEAASVALSAIRTLEQGDERPQLCEALTTYATALGKAGLFQQSRLAFERASDLARDVDDYGGAAKPLLMLVAELGSHLPFNILCRAYLRADEHLADAKRPEALEELRQKARRVLWYLRDKDASDERPNVIAFPSHLSESFLTPPVRDDLLADAGFMRGDRIAMRPTTRYSNGDLVLAMTPDGTFPVFIHILADGRLRLGGMRPGADGRTYLRDEVIILGVAER